MPERPAPPEPPATPPEPAPEDPHFEPDPHFEDPHFEDPHLEDLAVPAPPAPAPPAATPTAPVLPPAGPAAAEETVIEFAETTMAASIDEGGWRGATPDPEPEAAPPLDVRDIADLDSSGAATSRRALVATLLVGVVLVAVVSVGFVVFGRTDRDAGADPPREVATPQQTIFITPATEGAPTDVRLADAGSSVTLAWSDPTPGTVQFLITAAPAVGDRIARARRATTDHDDHVLPA